MRSKTKSNVNSHYVVSTNSRNSLWRDDYNQNSANKPGYAISYVMGSQSVLNLLHEVDLTCIRVNFASKKFPNFFPINHRVHEIITIVF